MGNENHTSYGKMCCGFIAFVQGLDSCESKLRQGSFPRNSINAVKLCNTRNDLINSKRLVLKLETRLEHAK